jgi:NAD-dependent dihydropyrimidine dehydrogenase PreA subunit
LINEFIHGVSTEYANFIIEYKLSIDHLKVESKFSESDASVDIFQLLLDAEIKKTKSRKTQLLEPLEVMEYFDGGDIIIDKKTCKGVECKLCIDACPTHALYWKEGEVGIVKDLCIFCTACVWNCVVDDCIQVWRKRNSGEIEKFSNPRNVLRMIHKIIGRRRRDRVKSRLGWSREIPSTRVRRRRIRRA